MDHDWLRVVVLRHPHATQRPSSPIVRLISSSLPLHHEPVTSFSPASLPFGLISFVPERPGDRLRLRRRNRFPHPLRLTTVSPPWRDADLRRRTLAPDRHHPTAAFGELGRGRPDSRRHKRRNLERNLREARENTTSPCLASSDKALGPGFKETRLFSLTTANSLHLLQPLYNRLG